MKVESRKKNRGVDYGAIPRPINLLNNTNVRFGVQERLVTEPRMTVNILSSALPFYQVD